MYTFEYLCFFGHLIPVLSWLSWVLRLALHPLLQQDTQDGRRIYGQTSEKTRKRREKKEAGLLGRLKWLFRGK